MAGLGEENLEMLRHLLGRDVPMNGEVAVITWMCTICTSMICASSFKRTRVFMRKDISCIFSERVDFGMRNHLDILL